MSAADDAAWERLVNDIAQADEEPLDDVLANFNPTVPASVLQSSTERFAQRDYVPALSKKDRFHAKPAKAHQTDALAMHARRDDTDFYEQVSALLRSKTLPQPPTTPDFMPIIIVPPTQTAVVQKCNVKSFLERGEFLPAPTLREMGDELATSLVASREAVITVRPHCFNGLPQVRVAFRKFRVVDDASKVDNWNHVCACFVTGDGWQFADWYNGSKKKSDPANLFAQVRGYYPYYEESKLPARIKEWRVMPLLMTHKETKAHSSRRVAVHFWEDLYQFLDTHPFFRRYSVMPVAGAA